MLRLCSWGFGRSNRAKTADCDDDEDYDYGDSSFQRTDVDNSWTSCRFLILDEVSMGGCGKLARISEALCKAKSNVLPFGGLSVLFSGDFHQLPPVMDVPLYVNPSSRKMPSLASKTTRRLNEEQQNGYNLFQDVTKTTVLLREHYRARDEAVYSVLDRIRCGNATATDKQLLHSRTFGWPGGPDVEDKEWRTAVLITTRNNIREAWSNVASLRHAVDNGTQIFISPSIDEGIDCNRRKMVWRAADSKTGFLPTWNVLCVDAPTIVKTNTAVELGTANGTKGIIREVIPDPEDCVGWSRIENQVVKLTRPPICVMVELVNDKHLLPESIGGRDGIFPMMPIRERFPCPKDFGGKSKHMWRIQQSLMSGFALSDHTVRILK